MCGLCVTARGIRDLNRVFISMFVVVSVSLRSKLKVQTEVDIISAQNYATIINIVLKKLY